MYVRENNIHNFCENCWSETHMLILKKSYAEYSVCLLQMTIFFVGQCFLNVVCLRENNIHIYM